MGGRLTPPRTVAAELLDAPSVPRRALAGNLRDLRRANAYLGGLAVVRRHLLPAIAALPADTPVRVLDVGTGAADVPLALVRWAARQGRRLSVVGVDHGRQVLAEAAAAVDGCGTVRLVRADARALPCAPASFDYALCSLTLHHLPPQDIVTVLAALARAARRGVVISDLERSWPGYLGTWLWSRACTTNTLTRHDGPLSVLRACTAAELRALADAAGLPHPRVYRHPFFRLALVAWHEVPPC
jgi:ubiquinone/menaquinone biosynthesis C-methylase UbiE